jgi:hypothetical protein
MFFFLVSLLSASVLSAGRMLEVMLCQKRGTPGLYPEAFMAARRDVVTLLFPMLFYAAGLSTRVWSIMVTPAIVLKKLHLCRMAMKH